MILLKSIHLYHFLSHDDTKILFSPTQKLLINGDSGAGKSSIADAMVWALYGKARCDNRSLIKSGQSLARVVLNISDGEAEYKIDRSINKSGKHEISLSEKNEDGSFSPSKVSGIKNIQEYVENHIIKASYLLFINSIAYPQDNGENFINQTAEKRKDIILEIAKASDYDNYYEVARDTSKERQTEVALLKGSISEKLSLMNEISKNIIDVEPLKIELQELEKSIFEINKEIAKGEESEKQRQELEKQKAIIETETNLNNKQLNELQDKMAIDRKFLDSLQTIDISLLENKEKRLKEVEQTLEEIKVKMKEQDEWKVKKQTLLASLNAYKDYSSDISELNKEIMAEMERTPDVCPDTGKPCCIFAKRQEQAIIALQKKITDKKTKESEDNLKKAEINVEIEKLGEMPIIDIDFYNSFELERKSLSNISYELMVAKNTIEKKENLAQELLLNERRVFSLLETKTALEQQFTSVLCLLQALPVCSIVSDLRYKKSLTEQGIFTVKTKIGRSEENAVLLEKTRKGTEEIESSIKQKEEDIDNLSVLKDAFSSTGIKSMVIDSIVPALEIKINEVLSRLSDFRVSLETQKSSTAGDKTLEGLFIIVTNGQNESFDLANIVAVKR